MTNVTNSTWPIKDAFDPINAGIASRHSAAGSLLPAIYAGDPRTRVLHTHIACIGDKPRVGPRFPEGEGMSYEELSTGHDAMFSAPREVAELLPNQLAL